MFRKDLTGAEGQLAKDRGESGMPFMKPVLFDRFAYVCQSLGLNSLSHLVVHSDTPSTFSCPEEELLKACLFHKQELVP